MRTTQANHFTHKIALLCASLAVLVIPFHAVHASSSYTSTPSSPSYGYSSSPSHNTTALQTKLAYQGFNPGPIDGIYGPRTKQAVTSFQRYHGLSQDGIAGPQTWSTLNKSGKVSWPGQCGHVDACVDTGKQMLYRSTGQGVRATAIASSGSYAGSGASAYAAATATAAARGTYTVSGKAPNYSYGYGSDGKTGDSSYSYGDSDSADHDYHGGGNDGSGGGSDLKGCIRIPGPAEQSGVQYLSAGASVTVY